MIAYREIFSTEEFQNIFRTWTQIQGAQKTIILRLLHRLVSAVEDNEHLLPNVMPLLLFLKEFDAWKDDSTVPHPLRTSIMWILKKIGQSQNKQYT
jgi:hypothetical protein